MMSVQDTAETVIIDLDMRTRRMEAGLEMEDMVTVTNVALTSVLRGLR